MNVTNLAEARMSALERAYVRAVYAYERNPSPATQAMCFAAGKAWFEAERPGEQWDALASHGGQQ